MSPYSTDRHSQVLQTDLPDGSTIHRITSSLASCLQSKGTTCICIVVMLSIELNYRAFICKGFEKPHMWTVMKQVQFHLMINTDYIIVIVDKPGRMNTKLPNFTLHHRKCINRQDGTQTTQSDCRTVLGGLTNDKQWFCINTGRVNRDPYHRDSTRLFNSQP